MHLGFVGLGDMGSLIVPRLMAAGHSVTGWNRTKAKAEDLIKAGMTWANTPREAAQGAYIVFSIVTDSKAVKAIALGPDGVIAGLKKGGAGSPHHGMHTTDTIDFEYSRSGEVDLILDDGQKQTLRPGDTVVLFSDGVTDATSAEGVPLGDERLAAVVEVLAGSTPDEILQALLDAVAEFARGAEQQDDVTLAVVQYLGMPGPSTD